MLYFDELYLDSLYYHHQLKYHHHFIGMGVSGGEVGALTGPSLMPGGQEAAYNKVSDILDAIAAKAHNKSFIIA
jgi:6-phosphogluconate dehydrogenase